MAQEILMLLVAGGLAIIAMLIALRLALWVMVRSRPVTVRCPRRTPAR